jgi:restriction system protein
MTKRRSKSALEEILDLVSLLPWWVGVLIAGVGYLVLHRMAVAVPVTMTQPGQVSSLAIRGIISGLAYAGQFIVPFIGLLGAAISFVRSKQRAGLVTDVAFAKSADSLDGMSWREFEMLVGEAYRLQGYRAIETGGAGADGGIDLVLSKGGEKFFVQCKQWKAFKVGVDVVRELYGVMAAKGAAGGFVVTSGSFTGDAKAFADGRNVQLVDGSKLFSMIAQAKRSRDAVDQKSLEAPEREPLLAVTEPSCPRCGYSMIKRTTLKGGNPGAKFWGCATFPACRGVRELK